MTDRILLAGFGGQGVMFIGKVLAYAGMLEDREVCWMPTYGPEMRGGTANCSVVLSDAAIHCPVIEHADAAILLNQPSYEKFLPQVKRGGVVIINSSIVNAIPLRDDVDIVAIPAGAIAKELGNSSIANMVCLGALLPRLKTVDLDGVVKAMNEVVGIKKPELASLNVIAVKRGLSFLGAGAVQEMCTV